MTICLSMIVKNEAHCIENCLNSVKPFINYWIICDTGSSDNTEEVVKNCLKDIPGEFHKHDWEDFSTNRNKSLELAKSKADYILVLDADDYIVINNVNAFNNLNHPAYNIEIVHGPIIYSRVQLFSSKINSRYVGVLHEYLEINVPAVQLKGVRIVFGATGSRSKDPDKYLKDALVFEKALLKEPNNVRYVFYAAQSYKDANNKEKAIELYLKRSKMGGWIEEQYISLLNIAKLYESLYPSNIIEIENNYIKAYNCNPFRVESLVYLCDFCRRNNLFNKSYFYAKIGINITKPNGALFLETDCYDWKIIDELAVAAFYIDKKKEAAILNRKLLNSSLLPIEQRSRIERNLNFCINQISF